LTQVTIYGSAKEIGRSAILIHDKDSKILLDCGLKIRPTQPTIGPIGVEKHAEDLQGIIISHAHFDHTGYLPKMTQEGYTGPIHMTFPTKDISSILWRDHLKIDGDRHWS